MNHRTLFTALLSELRPMIVKFLPFGFRRSDLACACAFSSFIIEKVLQELGYTPEMVIGAWDGYPHAWVVCQGLILDVTLTQFESKQPEIKVALENRCRRYVSEVRGQVAHEQLDSGIWNDQSPYQHRARIEHILAAFRKTPCYASFSPSSSSTTSSSSGATNVSS